MATASEREAHLRTVLLAIMSVALPAGVAAIWNQNSTLARLEEQSAGLRNDVNELRSELSKAADLRYRSTDAERDFGKIDRELDSLKTRVAALEGRKS